MPPARRLPRPNCDGICVGRRAQRARSLDDRATLKGRTGTNRVLITHFPNVKAALGVQIGFGDAAIPKPDGHGSVAVVARITAKEWAAY
jgi:hypothetical protein